MPQVAYATNANREHILTRLRLKPVRNSWAIQDLTIWPERTKLSYIEEGDRFSYLIVSGHPATNDQLTLLADGDAEHGLATGFD